MSMGSENGSKKNPSLASPSFLASMVSHKSSMSRLGALLLLLFFCFFSMTMTTSSTSTTSGQRRMVANLASDSPEMLGLKLRKESDGNTQRKTSGGELDDDEGDDGVDEGERAKLGVAGHRENDVDVEKIVEETVVEEENAKIATPRVRTTVYDPLPNQFQLNGEPFDFTSLRGKVTLFANVASN
jgi:hypothetical protein